MTTNNNSSAAQKAASTAATAKRIADTAKAVAKAAAGDWKALIKILLPVIVFFMFSFFIFTSLFAAWLLSPDGALFDMDTPDSVLTDNFKKEMIEVVTEAYSAASLEFMGEIDKHFSEDSAAYDYATKTVINTLNDSEIAESEIYKTYAMFTVLKEREIALERMKKPEMKIEDESQIYNIKDLKKIMSDKYDLLLSYEVTKEESEYQPTKWDEELEMMVDDGPPEVHCHYIYTINVKSIDDVGPAIFDLQDLSNSTDPAIPSEAKINEIERAELKTQTIAEIFGSLIAEYVSDYDYSSTIKEHPVTDINFNPNQKASVPLGAGYYYAKDSQTDFGWRIHPILNSLTFHTGVDIAAAGGTNIYSMANGVVASVGYGSGYGNYIVIYHGEIDGVHYFSTYNHMMEPSPLSEGEVVTSATVIGRVGSTGMSTGNHLHFEISVGTENADGSYSFVFKDPEMFINLGK